MCLRRRRRALLFIPLPAGSDQSDRWRRACASHAINRKYQIVSVTGDPGMVQAYLDARQAEVIVCGHPDHARMLEDLQPRLEVVSDPPPPHPDHRRTRRRRLLGD